MGVPSSEVGCNSATARRGDHESSYEHVVALEKKNIKYLCIYAYSMFDAEHKKLLFTEKLTEWSLLQIH